MRGLTGGRLDRGANRLIKWMFYRLCLSIYSSARRRVSANFDNTSKIRAFGSVRIFGDDAKGLSFGTGRRWSLSRSPLRQTVPPLMLRVPCAFYLFIRQPHGSEVSPAARNSLDSAPIPTASKLLICGLFQKGRVLAQDGQARPGPRQRPQTSGSAGRVPCSTSRDLDSPLI